jgi:nicotinamidase-related amidase
MKILIVIDMQNDFLHGALRNEEGIKIIPNVVSKVKEYKAENNLVIATRDTHEENYLETQEGLNLPVTHCIKGTNGWQINKDILEVLGDSLIFDKPSFGSLELARYLREIYFDSQKELEIEMLGVCTDICVISNAMLIKASLPEVKITVLKDLCAGVTIESHKNALEAMKMCQINVK